MFHEIKLHKSRLLLLERAMQGTLSCCCTLSGEHRSVTSRETTSYIVLRYDSIVEGKSQGILCHIQCDETVLEVTSQPFAPLLAAYKGNTEEIC